MKKALYLGIIGLAFCLSSCIDRITDEDRDAENDAEIQAYAARKTLPVQKTPSGLYYLIQQPGSGNRTPVDGDLVTFHYVLTRLTDEVIIDSSRVAKNKPFKLIFGASRVLEGLREGVGLLREGDKAVLLLPSKLAYGSVGGAALLPFATIRYDLNILKIRSEEEQINEYVAAKNLRIDQITDTGLRFTLLQKAELTADTVKATSKVTVKFAGRLLDDTAFEGGTGTSEFDLNNETAAIKGFREGLLKLRVGEKARIIFPSSLGYGTQTKTSATTNQTTIPPYSPLVFDIEAVSVVK